MDLITLSYTDSLNENEEKSISFSAALIKEPFELNSLFVTCVQGESMQPHIMHNALVISDLSNKEVVNGAIYLVHHEGNMWIKKAEFNESIAEFEFVSINPDFAHLIFKKENVHVIAKSLLTFTQL